MDRFARHDGIVGWDQQRLRDSCVAVCGRDWLGTFVVWALASMGVGSILWLGRPHPATERLARWFLADPGPFSGSMISAYELDVEYGPEVDWALGDTPVAALVCCAEDAAAHHRVWALSQRRQLAFVAGTTALGGWQGGTPPPYHEPTDQEPVTALAVGALLADAARDLVNPLPGSPPAPAGPLTVARPANSPSGAVILVGAGGIGTYVAFLAALLDYPLWIVDDDRVEAHNLNRQNLFSDADRHLYKARALQAAIRRLCPTASVGALVRRVGEGFGPTLTRLNVPAPVLVSAVDNAETRVVLQSLGQRLGMPVIHGGTSLFAADCYVQIPGGPLLDEQMHGALSAAAAAESGRARRGHRCAGEPSFVIPGLLAAALMVSRLGALAGSGQGFPALHWRSGSLPGEQGRMSDDDFGFFAPPRGAPGGADAAQ